MGRLGIYLLTIGAFLAVTSELMLIGIMDMVASDLRVSVSQVGQLVTAYALAFAIGAPIVITWTTKYERKRVMLISFCFFIFANLLSLWSPSFTILMIARALLGLSGGTFTVVAMGAVSKIVSPEKLGSAIGTIMMGLSGSLVFGVPLGIVLSGWIGWKLSFGVIALGSGVVLVGLFFLIPTIPGGSSIPLQKQFLVFKNSKILTGFFITLFVNAGSQTVYTFLVPFLQKSTDIKTSMIILIMFILGVFSMIGSRLGGFGVDRYGVVKTVYLSTIIHGIVLLLLPVFSASVITTVITLAIWMGFTWMTSPVLQTYFIQQAPQTPDLALSLNTSVVQIGIALGSSLGSLIVNQTGDVTNTTWLGAILVLLAIVSAWISFSIKAKPLSDQV
jgi:DHA1 family putative efflux transporter-like MFS transporter